MTFDFDRDKVCCFTGHRSLSPEKREAVLPPLRAAVRSLALDRGYTVFLTGGAVGFDLLAAGEILSFRERYGGVSLYLLLPFPGYDRRWPEAERELLRRQIEKADGVLYASPAYGPGVYHARDRMLVNFSSVCVSFLEKSTGGTYFTVSYAHETGVEVISLAKRLTEGYNDSGTMA